MNIEHLLKKARKLEHRGEIAGASELYQQLLTHYPANPRVVVASDRLKQMTKTPAQPRQPARPQPDHILSDLLASFNAGDYQKCLETGQNAAEIYPEEARISLVTGLCHAQLGQMEQAEKWLEHASENAPALADAHYNLGYVRKILGKHEQAITAYNACLAVKPAHEDALNNLGNLYLAASDYADAKACFDRLISLNADNKLAYANLGNLYKDQSQPELALEHYNKALSLDAEFIDALYNSALVLEDLGQDDNASERYKRVLSLNERHSQALNNLGKISINAQDYDRALGYLNSALSADPDNVSAHINIGYIHFETEQLSLAKQYFSNAVSLAPDHTDALNHLANSYFKNDEFGLAEQTYKKALQVNPDFTDALNNLGNLYRAQFQLDEAERCYHQALCCDPLYFKALNNLGILSRFGGRHEEALDYYNQSLAIFPDNPECLWNKSLILAMMGDFEAALPLYEVRWDTHDFNSKPLKTDRPVWSGRPEPRLLLWAEQGIGDEVMFASMLMDIYQQNAHLSVAIDSRLIDLFRRSFPAKINFVPWDHEKSAQLDFDEHLPLGSVMSRVGVSEAEFQRRSQPYLVADTQRVAAIRKSLGSEQGKRIIGISWKSKNDKSNKVRNCDLAQMLSILGRDDIIFVNLQYGDVADDIQRAEQQTGYKVLISDEMDRGRDIDGQAALICACDHVVSIDNSTVHFAGALGADTHVMLHVGPDWRWGIGRDTSYWYQSVTLYYQSEIGEFGPVLDRVSDRLSI